MLFIVLMALVTTAVAGAAAFFSVYGLAHTFTGAFWSVVFMGGALEAGKLMLASFLYRFKEVIDWKLKMPAYAFMLTLMMITSTGIYGYLSEAYQADTIGMNQTNAALDLKKSEQLKLQNRKTAIDTQISQLPSTDVRGRQRLSKEFSAESAQLTTRLTALDAEVQKLTEQQITTNAHVGPIVFIAKMLGLGPDMATNLLMLLIIFTFDPLAVLLTIATNIAIKRWQDEQVVPEVVDAEVVPEPEPEVNEPEEEPEPPEDYTWTETVITEVVPEPEEYTEPQTEIDPEVCENMINLSLIEDIIFEQPEIIEDVVPTPEADPSVLNRISDSFRVEEADDVTHEMDIFDDESHKELVQMYKEIKSDPETNPTDDAIADRIYDYLSRAKLMREVRKDSNNV